MMENKFLGGALGRSGLIKQFAEEVGKLIKWIISLFQETNSKLSALWAALAYAAQSTSAGDQALSLHRRRHAHTRAMDMPSAMPR